MSDCAWNCGRELTADERVHGTDGDEYYICSCCGKTTRVDREGVAHRVPDVRDALGAVMHDP